MPAVATKQCRQRSARGSVLLDPWDPKTDTRLDGTAVWVLPGRLSREEQASMLDELLGLPWEQNTVVVYGKTVQEKRETLFMADDPELTYAYSGRVCRPAKFCPAVDQARKVCEDAATRALGRPVRFNACLLNLYRDGSRAIGAHSDDERDMAADAPIVSLSLGATRLFDLLPRVATASRHRIALRAGTVVIMAGDTQKQFKHAVPVQKAIKDPRVSLTFRCVVRTAKQPNGQSQQLSTEGQSGEN